MALTERELEHVSGEQLNGEICRRLLRRDGIVQRVLPTVLESNASNESDKIAASTAAFVRFVESIGSMEAHDASGTKVWPVKYDPLAGSEVLARSRTMKEFPMHTDACFEDPAPSGIGLFVITADSQGGGQTRLIDSQDFIHRLTVQTIQCLQTKPFPIRVPDEFFKGSPLVWLPLLSAGGKFRFREELIERQYCSPEQCRAINELLGYLRDEGLVKSILLPEGSMLLLDNGRYFHARSQILDPQRHLLRVRFRIYE